MSKLTDLIDAMREAAGREGRGAAAWLELAQTNEGLRAAFLSTFGTRMPTPQKLGLWFNAHLGAKAAELTLLGAHSTHAKAWRYAVRSAADVAADAAEDAREETERRRARHAARELDIARLEKSAEVQARADLIKEEIKERMDARRAKGRNDGFVVVAQNAKREVKAAAADLVVNPFMPAGDFSEPAPLTHTRFVDGKAVREVIRDPRTGEAVPQVPQQAPKPIAPKPAAPTASVEPWTAGCGRPFTVADAIAANERAKCNRGGVTVFDLERAGNCVGADFDGNGVSNPNGTRPGGGRSGRRWSQDL